MKRRGFGMKKHRNVKIGENGLARFSGREHFDTKKQLCIRLACEIAKLRDHGCQFCGKDNVVLDAAHVIPRSRGFMFACDPMNILVLCRRCHAIWHSKKDWGYGKLEEKRPDIAEHVEDIRYAALENITRSAVERRLEELTEERKKAIEWNRLQQET